jgi:hypothetical protein
MSVLLRRADVENEKYKVKIEQQAWFSLIAGKAGGNSPIIVLQGFYEKVLPAFECQAQG